MTGDGAGHFLHTLGSAGNYMGSPSATSYYLFGKSPSDDDISIQNALVDMRVADDSELADIIAGNFEGAFSTSWTATNHQWLQYLFNVGGSGSYNFMKGRMNSGCGYVEVDYLDETVSGRIITYNTADAGRASILAGLLETMVASNIPIKTSPASCLGTSVMSPIIMGLMHRQLPQACLGAMGVAAG